MQLEKSSRKQTKIKISLAGSSGSGKSFSAILLGYGLCNDFSKMCIIDTENYSASFYSHLGDFNVINLTAPFHPSKYVEAIQLCEQSGIEVVIIDNASHAWSGKGGCLELHDMETSKMRVPNSFTAWGLITPLYQAFIDAIINSSCHVISTLRSKSEYILAERNGKQVPQKVGMAPMIRDGYEFEQSIAFDIDQMHKAFCTKDRSFLFQDRQPFVITTDTGRKILDWCNAASGITANDISKRINETVSIQDLLQLYQQYPQFKNVLQNEYEEKKRQIILQQQPVTPMIINPQTFSENGVH